MPSQTQQFTMEREPVGKAVSKLFEIMATNKSGTKTKKLFDEPQPLHIQISTVKIPDCPERQLNFVLPHSVLSDGAEVVLITSTLKNADVKDYDKNKEHYQNILDKHNIKGIKEIISYQQMKNEYGENEMQLRFLNLYDLFLVETNIHSYVLKTFGHNLDKKNKLVVPVNMKASALAKNVDSALSTAQVKIHENGDCYNVVIGHTGLKPNQIVDNILEFSKQLGAKLPGGFLNINGLYLRSLSSSSVQFYMNAARKSAIGSPKFEEIAKKTGAVTGELSTEMDKKITVHPDGDVDLHDVESDDEHNYIAKRARKPVVKYDNSSRAIKKKSSKSKVVANRVTKTENKKTKNVAKKVENTKNAKNKKPTVESTSSNVSEPSEDEVEKKTAQKTAAAGGKKPKVGKEVSATDEMKPKVVKTKQLKEEKIKVARVLPYAAKPKSTNDEKATVNKERSPSTSKTQPKKAAAAKTKRKENISKSEDSDSPPKKAKVANEIKAKKNKSTKPKGG